MFSKMYFCQVIYQGHHVPHPISRMFFKYQLIFYLFMQAFCLAYVSDIIPPGGFTPGKRIMGLAVVGCNDVFSLGNDRFLVTGIRNPSLKR